MKSCRAAAALVALKVLTYCRCTNKYCIRSAVNQSAGWASLVLLR